MAPEVEGGGPGNLQKREPQEVPAPERAARGGPENLQKRAAESEKGLRARPAPLSLPKNLRKPTSV